MVVTIDMLRRFRIFEELNDRELEQIAHTGKIEELGEGATLTENGAPATSLYLIVDGKVSVSVRGPKGHELQADELGPNQLLGWSSLVGPYVYTATAQTTEKSTVIVFSGSKMRQIFEINNHIGYRVLKGMGNVVSRRIQAIESKCAAQLERGM
jgi:CRP-like cAMP-binding protein